MLLEQYSKYAVSQENKYGKVVRSELIKPLLNLFHGEYNGKLFRTIISNQARSMIDQSIDTVIMKSTSCLSNDVLDLT